MAEDTTLQHAHDHHADDVEVVVVVVVVAAGGKFASWAMSTSRENEGAVASQEDEEVQYYFPTGISPVIVPPHPSSQCIHN